jgi:outer membrane protein OmpA-like peptidoglycan-associated protein
LAGTDTGSAEAAVQGERQSSDEAAGRNALAENAAAGTTAAGSSESDSSLSAAQSGSHSGAAQSATEQDLTGTAGGAQTGTAGLSEKAERAGDAGAPASADGRSAAAASATGTTAQGGTGLDQAAAAAAGGSAAQPSSGASEGGGALSQERTAQQAGPTAKQQEVIVGLVEAPGRKATPTETVIPQTLGGMLPLTLGVEGEGEFDFDQAVLREQVRVVLDELAMKLKTADYDRLEIVGHTDRIGTEDYNQYLSERRAWAVARYLIQKGVPVTKVRVEGRGMHEPVTAANACAGLTREATIACLQEDRRVVISASIRRVDVNVH